jgi:hypothetical protein
LLRLCDRAADWHRNPDYDIFSVDHFGAWGPIAGQLTVMLSTNIAASRKAPVGARIRSSKLRTRPLKTVGKGEHHAEKRNRSFGRTTDGADRRAHRQGVCGSQNQGSPKLKRVETEALCVGAFGWPFLCSGG